MTSLSVSKVKKYRQKLESEGFIQCNKDKGSYKYQIKTLPSGTDKITLRDKAINPKDTVYQGAKETIKENLKKDDLFCEFKKNYPANKYDDDAVLDAWQSITEEEQQLIVGSMGYAKEYWQLSDNKFIPYASNYLLKGYFRKEEIILPYKRELSIQKEEKMKKEYYLQAEADAASEDEVMEFISAIKQNLNKRKQQKNHDLK